MKRTFNIYAICWVILLIMFNIVVFLIPNEIAGESKYSNGFWIGYSFVTISFIGQFVCTYYAFKRDSLKEFFYSIPLITISYVSTIVSILVGMICIVVPFIPTWIGTIVCLLILGFSAVTVLRAKATAGIVSEVDDKIKAQTIYIKALTSDAQTLMEKASSPELKPKLKKVYEAIRYSDPMSNEALANIESQITIRFDELLKAIESNNSDEVKELADEVVVLLNDRNEKCRLLK